MANINPQFTQIGEQFTQHYYNTFDTNRAGLSALYCNESMLSFEGEQFQGVNNIVEKIKGLPFQSVKHNIVKADYQPNPVNGGVIIFVTGDLFVDGSPNPLKFAQTFVLSPAAGSFVITNDLFRLNIG